MKYLLGTLFIFFAICGFAKEMTGKVIAVDGQATTGAKGKKNRQLKRGSVIFTDEMIHVQEASKLQIRFTDGSLLNLIPNTKYQIKAYSYSEDKSSNQYIGQIFTGGFRHLTGDIAKTNPDKVQIKTPTSTIGVRGTVFEVLLLSGQAMTVGCTLGQISVTNPAGHISLGPTEQFQFSTVSAGASPQGQATRPANFSEAIFSSPMHGIQTTPEGTPHGAPTPARVKGGC